MFLTSLMFFTLKKKKEKKEKGFLSDIIFFCQVNIHVDLS